MNLFFHPTILGSPIIAKKNSPRGGLFYHLYVMYVDSYNWAFHGSNTYVVSILLDRIFVHQVELVENMVPSLKLRQSLKNGIWFSKLGWNRISHVVLTSPNWVGTKTQVAIFAFSLYLGQVLKKGLRKYLPPPKDSEFDHHYRKKNK